jgi:AcrR family transcriptional regulator
MESMGDRILGAAIEAASVHGIGRLSVADVAKRAGVSRPTVYKHFPSKDALVAAAVRREAAAFVTAVTSAIAPIADAREAVGAAVLLTLELARQHPLLDRVVRTEPERLVPLLTTDEGRVLPLVRIPVEAVVAERFPGLDGVTRRRTADVVVRLLISFALNPPDDPPEVVAGIVAGVLVDGVRAAEGVA